MDKFTNFGKKDVKRKKAIDLITEHCDLVKLHYKEFGLVGRWDDLIKKARLVSVEKDDEKLLVS